MEPEIGFAPLVRDRHDEDLLVALLIDDAVRKAPGEDAAGTGEIWTSCLGKLSDLLDAVIDFVDELVTEPGRFLS